ncbi:hypothetical protein PTTG_12076 [Puccinia triticina 1-1 BBBD Race 1]|uniref:Uncharacterized protein n=1 Tax=Puccinia triticina (isolate 1-1 / race 1 (BBBD)) TaxID=630390 RepID=A0A180GXP8_PUCT1|nr:hypothetical protein PTTG_12076 [Puccinia triticina 1-1 BBBD Race 1]
MTGSASPSVATARTRRRMPMQTVPTAARLSGPPTGRSARNRSASSRLATASGRTTVSSASRRRPAWKTRSAASPPRSPLWKLRNARPRPSWTASRKSPRRKSRS